MMRELAREVRSAAPSRPGSRKLKRSIRYRSIRNARGIVHSRLTVRVFYASFTDDRGSAPVGGVKSAKGLIPRLESQARQTMVEIGKDVAVAVSDKVISEGDGTNFLSELAQLIASFKLYNQNSIPTMVDLMKKSDKARIAISEKRQKLNSLLEHGVTDENRAEVEKLTKELSDHEVEYRAAILAEADEDRTAPNPDPARCGSAGV